MHPTLNYNYNGRLENGTYDHNYNWYDANKKSNKTNVNLECGVDSKQPCDDLGHGTHTMSIAVGKNGIGVSPYSKWIACKNMDQNFGSPQTYLSCLQFLLAPHKLDGSDPRPDLRPHAIGNSYGCEPKEGCSKLTFSIALESLKSFGIFIAVSSGNDGYDGCSSINYPPATDPLSFNVGALSYKSNTLAMYSSIGPVSTRKNAIDVVAPGSYVNAAFPKNKYQILYGTSMAAPHVASAALLITAACPHLERKVEDIENLLRDTATKINPSVFCGNDEIDQVPNNEYGYGAINLEKAVETCLAANNENII